jgi:hypothetical protein
MVGWSMAGEPRRVITDKGAREHAISTDHLPAHPTLLCVLNGTIASETQPVIPSGVSSFVDQSPLVSVDLGITALSTVFKLSGTGAGDITTAR